MNDCEDVGPLDWTVSCRWCGAGLYADEELVVEKPWGKYHPACLEQHVAILGDRPAPKVPLWTDATQLTPAARTLYARLTNDTTRKDNRP